MLVHGHLYGGAPILAKLQIGEALPLAGVPLEAAGVENDAGVLASDTDSCTATVGISLDAQPNFYTEQRLGNADPAVYVTVSTRADLIARARLSGGATSNTPLPEFVNTLASTDGLLVTAPFGTEYADAYIYGANGSNVGQLRKVDDTTDTAAVPFVAFPFDIPVGDIFYAVNMGPYEVRGVIFTTDVTQLNTTLDARTVETFRCLGVFLKPKNAGGALDSYADLAIQKHWITVAGS